MRCFEVRIALEGEVAHLAASRRTEDDLEAIKAALEELDGVIARGEVGERGRYPLSQGDRGREQEQAVCRDAGNVATHVFPGNANRGAQHVAQRSQARRQLVQEEHIAIYEAIKREDPEAARATMRAHIDNHPHPRAEL